MSRTHQDAVIFVGIQRAYEPSSDVVVRFQRGGDLVPSTTQEDWIGLFRVGWTSVRERITSVLAPQPTPNQLESKVTFAGSNMPAEDGRFYQFCHVTKEGAVRGASAPFQFTRSRKVAGTEFRLKEAAAVEAPHPGTPADHKQREAVLQEKDKIIEDGRRRVSSLEDQVREKTSLLDEADSRLHACLENNAQLKLHLEEEAEKNKRLLEEVLEGQESCQAALKQRDALQEELERTRAEKKNLEAAIEDQKERLNRATATHLEQLNALKVEGRSRVTQMEHQALMLRQAQDQARALEGKLVEKEEELGLVIKTLEAELDQACAEKQRYEELAASAKEENSKLEEAMQCQTSELVLLQVEKQTELAEKEKQERLLTQDNFGELTGGKGLGTVPPAAKGTVERSVYDALQAAYESLERHYQEAREKQEKEDSRKAAAYVHGLESQCDELRARVAQCKKEYEAKAKECLDLRMRSGTGSRADATEYQARIKSLEQQVKGLSENNSKLSKELVDREETVRQQGGKISVLEQQLADSEQRYVELKEQSGFLERDSSLSASLSRVCPICSIEFSLGAPASDFEHHVNSHLHD